jgi:3-phenylpropionate/trans-cinnamate dioxygenase ferredoxin subunit
MTVQAVIPEIDLPAPGARSLLRIEGRSIAVFNVQGTLYAIDSTCPHAGASLANGLLDGHTVQCRAHGLRFDLRTGCMPGSKGLSVKSYAIEMREGQTYISISKTDEISQ